MQHLHSTLCIK